MGSPRRVHSTHRPAASLARVSSGGERDTRSPVDPLPASLPASPPDAEDDEPELDVTPPLFSWGGTFLDRAVECEYRHTSHRESFFRQAARLACLELGMIVLVLTFGVQSSRALLAIIIRSAVAGLLNSCFLLFAVTAQSQRTVSLALGQALATAWQCMLVTTVVMLANHRVEYFLGAIGGGASSNEPAATSVMAALVSTMAAGLVLPLNLGWYALILLWTVSQLLFAEFILPAPGNPLDFDQLAAFVAAFIILSYAVLRRVVAMRSQWFFGREVVAATRRWRHEEKERTAMAVRTSAAESATTARGRLIRIVMHDLRSPLLTITNMMTELKEMAPSTTLAHPAVSDCVDSLATCATLMETIVSDMLDFERIDSGRLSLVPERFGVCALVTGALHTFAGQARARGVRLQAAVPSGSARSARVYGDMRRLQQCLNNGVSNALKFSPAGAAVTIGVAVEPATLPAAAPAAAESAAADAAPAAAGARGRGAADGAEQAWAMRVDVVDQGPGLTAAEMRTLLHGEAFTQVGQGQLQGNGGTGLGLMITRQLLKLHGPGCGLELSSDGLGKGATFTLRLLLPAAPPADEQELQRTAGASGPAGAPAADAPAGQPKTGAAAALAVAQPASAESTPPAQPRASPAKASQLTFPPSFRLLYVEDDAILRRSMRLRVFGKLGVPYDEAEDGQHALQAFEAAHAQRYALVITDNQMPRMRGDEAVRALRAAGFSGRIVGMTGDPVGSADRHAFEAAGLDECVNKDTPGINRIKELLSGYALPRQVGGGGAEGAAEAPPAEAPARAPGGGHALRQQAELAGGGDDIRPTPSSAHAAQTAEAEAKAEAEADAKGAQSAALSRKAAPAACAGTPASSKALGERLDSSRLSLASTQHNGSEPHGGAPGGDSPPSRRLSPCTSDALSVQSMLSASSQPAPPAEPSEAEAGGGAAGVPAPPSAESVAASAAERSLGDSPPRARLHSLLVPSERSLGASPHRARMHSLPPLRHAPSGAHAEPEAAPAPDSASAPAAAAPQARPPRAQGGGPIRC